MYLWVDWNQIFGASDFGYIGLIFKVTGICGVGVSVFSEKKTTS